MKIGISACLTGVCCRYDGNHCFRPELMELLKGHELVLVCPEVMAGWSSPRIPCERFKDRVIDRNQNDVTCELAQGVQKALKKLELSQVDMMIVKSCSPTCGKGLIYDGTFQGRLIPGDGLLVEALKQRDLFIVQVD